MWTSLTLGWVPARSAFMSLIQAFWFVAFAAADRMATSPESPISLVTMSTSTLAMPSALAWLTNRSRNCGSVSESKGTTLVPALLAWFSADPIALGLLAGTTRALVPCCAAVLMNGTCASGLAASGPTSLKVPPNLVTAVLPPLSLVSKYGLRRFLGRQVTEMLSPDPPLPDPEPPSLEPPHAEVTRARLATSAPSALIRLLSIFMDFPFMDVF